MKTLSTAKLLFHYIQTSQWKNLSNILDDNFTFSGHTPRPLDKQEFIAHYKELTRAFTNWHNKIEGLSEKEKGHIKGTIQVNCHHTGTYYPQMWYTPILFPTLKYISLPKEKFDIGVEDGMVVGLICYPHPTGGMVGLIREAGERIPA